MENEIDRHLEIHIDSRVQRAISTQKLRHTRAPVTEHAAA